jgi:hypothetical protein
MRDEVRDEGRGTRDEVEETRESHAHIGCGFLAFGW